MTVPAPSRRLVAERTPARSPGSGASLPGDVAFQACRRVGTAALAFAFLWLIPFGLYLSLSRFGPDLMGSYAQMWPMPGALIAGAGVVVSLGMVLMSRAFEDRHALLLDLGLVFEVVMALLTGLYTLWVPPVEFRGISFTCIIILAYPSIAPNTPKKILVASLAAATMDPVAWGIVKAIRGPEVALGARQMFEAFVPSYISALLAVLPAHLIRQLGRQVRSARELGSYRLGEVLGAGGMGEVHRAEHRLLARPAAIKLIRPEALSRAGRDGRVVVERFKREARAAAALRSPHTIELYDFGTADDGTLYYAMELLDGVNLEALVQRFGPVPPERVVHFIRQACLSLGEAHANGLVHRDIKPSNIFAARLGLMVDFIKVLDFGLVKAVTGNGGDTRLTAPQIATGTPAYISPEAAVGDAVDPRADIYSLGCVAYWLLTGRTVFDADTPVKMMYRHIQDPPVPPSQLAEFDVPRELDDLVLACLAKKPESRPQSVTDVIRRLDAVPLAEPWTEGRARRWWEAHLPAPEECGPCDAGVLRPAAAVEEQAPASVS
ncbi:MAG TPA: serine/threonine-protein kinase [Gemmatimonadales bacterium]|nr:serine/threonine-protein kinase [Gemmatimonadales bacterium]